MQDLIANLSRIVEYTPSDGTLRWRVKRNSHGGKAQPGNRVGWLRSDGYLETTLLGKKYKVHRLVWLLNRGVWPKRHIDHVNGKRDDNRIENLREATPAQNNQHSSKVRPNNTSGMPGVCWDRRRGKWYAQIQVEGKHVFLGYFTEKQDAGKAYAEGKRKHHPFHIPLNPEPR